MQSLVPAFPENPRENLPEVTTEQRIRILEFGDIGNLASQYELNSWAPDEEIRTLIQIARYADKDTTKLMAIRRIQTHRQEVLKNSGHIVTATQTTESPDGTRQVLSTSVVAIALKSLEQHKPEGESNDQEESNQANQTHKEHKELKINSSLKPDPNSDSRKSNSLLHKPPTSATILPEISCFTPTKTPAQPTGTTNAGEVEGAVLDSQCGSDTKESL